RARADQGPPARPQPPPSPVPGASAARDVPAAAAGARWVRRTVERGGASVRSATEGSPRWVSGVLAGAQAAVLSLLVVAMPALAAYVATSADPANAEVGWTRSVGVGAALWLLGHGGALRAGGATLTLVPLGITGLALFACYASARRSSHRTVSAWLSGVGGYLAVVLLVLLLAGGTGPLGAGAGAVVRLMLGAATVAALGLGAGVARPRRVRAATQRWWGRLDHPVRAGAVGGMVAAAALVGAASLLTGFWVLSGRAAAGDVVAGLGVDTFGGLLLAVAQLAVAPDLVAWAFAWLAGPGFAVGEGTLYAPSGVVAGPLPALPLLGALPVEGGGLVRWAPVVTVAAGLLAGAWLHRRLVVGRARDVLVAVGVLAVAAGALGAVVAALGSGAAGPGRLAVVGASPVAVGLAVAAGALVGAALAAVPADATVREAVRRGARGAWDRVRGRADVDLGGDDAPEGRDARGGDD
uniref:cell division protein PerM n=1 Tax=Actinotalea solisilvae TaxID=2072922 RepID=UPI0018F1C500